MANRYFRQFMNTSEPQVVKLFGRVTFGSSGAPTLVTASSKGIASITRSSAGKYVITLGPSSGSVLPGTPAFDTYNALLNFNSSFDESGNAGTAPAAPSHYIFAQTVTTTGTITVQYNLAGTATDPASGEAVFIEITLKNSSAF